MAPNFSLFFKHFKTNKARLALPIFLIIVLVFSSVIFFPSGQSSEPSAVPEATGVSNVTFHFIFPSNASVNFSPPPGSSYQFMLNLNPQSPNGPYYSINIPPNGTVHASILDGTYSMNANYFIFPGIVNASEVPIVKAYLIKYGVNYYNNTGLTITNSTTYNILMKAGDLSSFVGIVVPPVYAAEYAKEGYESYFIISGLSRSSGGGSSIGFFVKNASMYVASGMQGLVPYATYNVKAYMIPNGKNVTSGILIGQMNYTTNDSGAFILVPFSPPSSASGFSVIIINKYLSPLDLALILVAIAAIILTYLFLDRKKSRRNTRRRRKR
ncbi:MAG: hypothetical protein QW292_05765 [Candidatus Parvarchaeota archaeon]